MTITLLKNIKLISIYWRLSLMSIWNYISMTSRTDESNCLIYFKNIQWPHAIDRIFKYMQHFVCLFYYYYCLYIGTPGKKIQYFLEMVKYTMCVHTNYVFLNSVKSGCIKHWSISYEKLEKLVSTCYIGSWPFGLVPSASSCGTTNYIA